MHNSITVHETRENIHLFCTYMIFLPAFLINIDPHEVQKLICVNQRGNVDIYQSRFFENFLRKRIMLYHRLNMEVDLQSLFGLYVTCCAQWYLLAETPQPFPPQPFPPSPSPRIGTHIRGRFSSALCYRFSIYSLKKSVFLGMDIKYIANSDLNFLQINFLCW